MVSVSIKVSQKQGTYANWSSSSSDNSSDSDCDDYTDSSSSSSPPNNRKNKTCKTRQRTVDRDTLANAIEKRLNLHTYKPESTLNIETCYSEKNTTNKKKKQKVPAAVKRLVWNKYIGETIGKTKCMCCIVTDITQLSFHCGHIISEVNGGTIDILNLRPICQNCNSSMGTMNMTEFISKYKLHSDFEK